MKKCQTGIVLIISLCLGKTLICTNTTGTSDFMTNGKDGLVVPSSDPVALAEAIVALVEQSTSLAEMGVEARHTFLRHFSENRFTEKLVDVVRGITSKYS